MQGVIKKRLAYPSGKCHIIHTVRSQALLSKWTSALHAAGLCTDVCKLQPDYQGYDHRLKGYPESNTEQIRPPNESGPQYHPTLEEGATMHRADFYEGGFVALHIQHATHVMNKRHNILGGTTCPANVLVSPMQP